MAAKIQTRAPDRCPVEQSPGLDATYTDLVRKIPISFSMKCELQLPEQQLRLRLCREQLWLVATGWLGQHVPSP